MIACDIGAKNGKLTPRANARLASGLIQYAIDLIDRDFVARSTAEALVEYAMATQPDRKKEMGIEAGEKVLFYGARNLIGDDPKDWRAQFAASGSRHGSSAPIVVHWVLSLKKDEDLARDQAEKLIDLFAQVMGAERLQMVWAAHENTDNTHLHLVVNRIDAATCKPVQLGGGWAKEAGQMVCALATAKLGFQPERNCAYMADPDGTVRDAITGIIVRHASGKIGRLAGNRERRDDLKRETPELRLIVDVIRSAASWNELHEQLHRRRAHYSPVGSGAEIRLPSGQLVKASGVARDCSLGAVEKRLGDFAPTAHPTPDSGFAAYKAAIASTTARLRSSRELALADLDATYVTWSASLSALPFDAQIVGHAMAAEFLRARSAIAAAFAPAFADLRGLRLSERAWLAGGKPTVPEIAIPVILVPSGLERTAPTTLAGYDSMPTGSFTAYRAAGGSSVAFEDHCAAIVVRSSADRDVEAALMLAASRWETVRVHGPAETVARIAAFAKAAGISIEAVVPDGLSTSAAAAPIANSATPTQPSLAIAEAAPATGTQPHNTESPAVPSVPIAPIASTSRVDRPPTTAPRIPIVSTSEMIRMALAEQDARRIAAGRETVTEEDARIAKENENHANLLRHANAAKRAQEW